MTPIRHEVKVGLPAQSPASKKGFVQFQADLGFNSKALYTGNR